MKALKLNGSLSTEASLGERKRSLMDGLTHDGAKTIQKLNRKGTKYRVEFVRERRTLLAIHSKGERSDGVYGSPRNSSTVKPEARINGRSVPFATSSC